MRVDMQGFAFHTFAAVMTFTVLAFPTPSDLYNTVASRFADNSLQEINSFPTIEGNEPPVNTFVDTEEFVPVIAACVVAARDSASFDPIKCEDAIQQLAAETGSPPAAARIATDEAILQVATSFYCRAKWTEAKRFGRAFDINDCMGTDLPLAQPIN